MSKSKSILNKHQLDITINRLCRQLIENHNSFNNTVLIGLQPRGVFLANRIEQCLKQLSNDYNIESGQLDITFYRDDFRRRDYEIIPSATEIDFIIENKNVIFIIFNLIFT